MSDDELEIKLNPDREYTMEEISELIRNAIDEHPLYEFSISKPVINDKTQSIDFDITILPLVPVITLNMERD